MEKYILKYFWTLNLVTIAVCAFLAAKTANTFTGAYLSAGAEIAAAANDESEEKPSEKTDKAPRKAAVNPFTGEKMIALEPVVPTDAQKETTPMPENPMDFTESTECSKTSIPGTLVGTVASTNPANGFAMIQNAEQKIKLYEVGHEIQSGATIAAVVRHKVFIDNSGRIECMFHGEQVEKKKKPKTPEDAKKEAGEGVRKVSENEYIISEAEIAGAMENLNLLATQARIVPSFKNGVANGFRIYSIKPGSLYQKIGMKNGDIIQRVNSLDIDSPEKALEIYSKLRSEKRITLDLLRRGSKISVDYTIQ